MQELSLINCRLDRRYDIHDQLGRGSYSEVFLARDILASPQSPRSSVVIKALNVFLQDDLDHALERTLVENFQNEAIALDRVRHPNIISRIGHGTARDLRGTVFHYLVIEYMPGGDLQGLVRRQKLSLADALRYIEQTGAGLAHAHERGIIHRDIKPQNLLLSEDKTTVKIADFGVARVEMSDAPITRVGTNIYAPPEHSPMFAGKTGELAFGQLTPAADIYSLAKSAYTLITGEAPRPFTNETVTYLPEAIAEEPWANDLLRVLSTATSADPSDRQQSIDEFWSELAPVREAAGDGEYGTVLKSADLPPRPHVSRGYSPLPPEMPNFESSPEASGESTNATKPTFTPPALKYPAMPDGRNSPIRVDTNTPHAVSDVGPVQLQPAPQKKRRRSLRRLAAFAALLIGFTGVLYGTASYLRSRNIIPEIRNPFQSQTGKANTDLYLRPSPNTEGDPIGYVTKNSKVRVVTSQNNWYQVDVIEQGRVRAYPATATRGWLNGKYLDLGDN